MSHLSSLLFGLLLIPVAPVVAQKTAEHDILITFSGLVNEHGEKVIRTALHDLDARALVSISVPLQQAKFHGSAVIDPATLAAFCAPHGIEVVSIERLDIDPVRRSLLHELPGFPEYIDTGNPHSDAADYEARKQTWIDAHPGLYPPPVQLDEHDR